MLFLPSLKDTTTTIMSNEMFTPYQIDFSTKNTSKTFGFSKKKVTFKFGVANNQSLAQGLTGANCRGSEHEIIFTWSLNSGKRQILADGKDVHYSETGQNGWTSDQVFQHQFLIRVPGLSAPLRCHLITQPANRDMPQIQPFDLRVNGMSYFSMSKIFQLGTPQMISRPVAGGGRSSSGRISSGGQPYSQETDPYMTAEERKAVAAAKVASLRDLERQRSQQLQQSFPTPAPAPPPRVEENLISLMDDPAPLPQMGPGQAQFASSNTFEASLFGGGPPPGTYGQQPPPPPQQAYNNYSMGSMSSLNGQPPLPQQASFSSPYASQGSFGSSQMSPSRQSFGQAPPVAAYPPPQQQQQQQPQQQYYQQQQYPQPLAPAPFGTPQQAMPSPSNQTMASYQSYGSAPTFAQPPQQQYQQQPPPQQQYYGAPQPPPQGYGQY